MQDIASILLSRLVCWFSRLLSFSYHIFCCCCVLLPVGSARDLSARSVEFVHIGVTSTFPKEPNLSQVSFFFHIPCLPQQCSSSPADDVQPFFSTLWLLSISSPGDLDGLLESYVTKRYIYTVNHSSHASIPPEFLVDFQSSSIVLDRHQPRSWLSVRGRTTESTDNPVLVFVFLFVFFAFLQCCVDKFRSYKIPHWVDRKNDISIGQHNKLGSINNRL